jgi:plasmid stabilization system protein ParE
MFQVVFTLRARRQLTAASRWWLEHRDKAPDAFEEDVSRGLATLAEQPRLGERVAAKAGVHRIFLRRIGYFLYYRIASGDTVEVLAVWHHSRGSGPPL